MLERAVWRCEPATTPAETLQFHASHGLIKQFKVKHSQMFFASLSFTVNRIHQISTRIELTYY